MAAGCSGERSAPSAGTEAFPVARPRRFSPSDLSPRGGTTAVMVPAVGPKSRREELPHTRPSLAEASLPEWPGRPSPASR